MSDSYGVLAASPIAPWAPIAAFAVSLLAVWLLAASRFSSIILDHPKSRSLHEVPKPRTGGLGLHAGVVVALCMIASVQPSALWVAYSIVLLISFCDDVRGIAPAWRLLVHISACGLFSYAVFEPWGTAAVMAATLLCAWMTNLYNFMDGSDGLAGGMAVSGFSFYGVAAWLSGNPDFALINFSIAAAALGFLAFNFHPARIFLGDAGSVPLGFLAASLGMLGYLRQSWSWWYPLLVFAPFIVDASVTLMRRVVRLEKIWQAHRDHYYQRLVQMGWGHRKTALAEYALMVLSGITALAGMSLSIDGQIAVLAATGIFYLALIVLIDFGWRRLQAPDHS